MADVWEVGCERVVEVGRKVSRREEDWFRGEVTLPPISLNAKEGENIRIGLYENIKTIFRAGLYTDIHFTEAL